MGSVTLTLNGRVVPKARPRLGRSSVHLPANYRKWRNLAETELAMQFIGCPTIDKAIIEIRFLGSHRGDLDNLCGSCLDALKSAKVIKDDRLSCVPKLIVEHIANKRLIVEIKIDDIT